MTQPSLPPGYCLLAGSPGDRPLLARLMERTYGELFPGMDLEHLKGTVDSYFPQSHLWWVYSGHTPPLAQGLIPRSPPNPIAGLWLGSVVDQVSGDRHSHILLLYVDPAHRRQGLGRALLDQAETWAKKNHDRQITLQVFCDNQSALALYHSQGYRPQVFTLVKPLSP
ncbi:MAG: GNAT family N-acetyltransferase [Prochlorothrix sp.]|nr:GNAT family N-acetyltransferase [Prochlorothrix sp.]